MNIIKCGWIVTSFRCKNNIDFQRSNGLLLDILNLFSRTCSLILFFKNFFFLYEQCRKIWAKSVCFQITLRVKKILFSAEVLIWKVGFDLPWFDNIFIISNDLMHEKMTSHQLFSAIFQCRKLPQFNFFSIIFDGSNIILSLFQFQDFNGHIFWHKNVGRSWHRFYVSFQQIFSWRMS